MGHGPRTAKSALPNLKIGLRAHASNERRARGARATRRISISHRAIVRSCGLASFEGVE
jgi:hypothetical protein